MKKVHFIYVFILGLVIDEKNLIFEKALLYILELM